MWEIPKKNWDLLGIWKLSLWHPSKWHWPIYKWKKNSDSRVHGIPHKNFILKICTESRYIGQNVSNFPWVWAGRFEYHEPYNPYDFFSPLKGPEPFWGVPEGELPDVREVNIGSSEHRTFNARTASLFRIVKPKIKRKRFFSFSSPLKF